MRVPLPRAGLAMRCVLQPETAGGAQATPRGPPLSQGTVLGHTRRRVGGRRTPPWAGAGGRSKGEATHGGPPATPATSPILFRGIVNVTT